MVVAANTRELLLASSPLYPSHELTVGGPDIVKFASMTDGTTTVVQITLYGEPIGTGVAKRRLSDERNQELGMALALTRAFTDAATRYATTVDHMLNPEPDPSGVAIKELRKLVKSDSKRRKDIRRRKARESFYEANGWDHTDPPGDGVNEHLRKAARRAAEDFRRGV